MEAAERSPCRPGENSPRRDRDHLRIEAERDIRERVQPDAPLLMQPWWVYRKGLDGLSGGPAEFTLRYEFVNRRSRTGSLPERARSG